MHLWPFTHAAAAGNGRTPHTAIGPRRAAPPRRRQRARRETSRIIGHWNFVRWPFERQRRATKATDTKAHCGASNHDQPERTTLTDARDTRTVDIDWYSGLSSRELPEYQREMRMLGGPAFTDKFNAWSANGNVRLVKHPNRQKYPLKFYENVKRLNVAHYNNLDNVWAMLQNSTTSGPKTLTNLSVISKKGNAFTLKAPLVKQNVFGASPVFYREPGSNRFA